jgi:DNA-binding response OmpR family regulator
LEAYGTSEALEFARQPTQENIQLLLTVLALPGASGSELAAAIKTSWPAMKVLFMSPFTGPSESIHPSGAGVASLQKPFTPETLAVAVRELLDGNGRG